MLAMQIDLVAYLKHILGKQAFRKNKHVRGCAMALIWKVKVKIC